MDKNKLSLIMIINKFVYQIKLVVVVLLVLIAASSYAATETTNEPPYAVSPKQKTNLKINTTMVILFAFLLTALFSVCIFFFYLRRHSERQLTLSATTGHGSDERTAMRLEASRGLDPDVIAAFTSFTYSTVKDIKIGQHVLECGVCLNELQDHEALRLLPECNHVFHQECIDEWLGSHVTCPVCRASLVPRANQRSRETELSCGRRHTKDPVSIELVNLKHDLAPSRKLSRSCSMGHVMMQPNIENVDQYTLRLPYEVQHVLKNTGTGTDVSLLLESSLNTSLKSASANFIRGSNYFGL